MRKPNAVVFDYLLLLSVLCFVSSTMRSASATPSPPKYQFIGISPEDEKYYKSSEVIKCRDGSKKFSINQLNDDFCDCIDGTDEPGTSACPNGKFYCKNAGHVPLSLYSSRVNDGVCDCCDGSDEYDGKVKCPNTCWEAGKVARDKLNKKIVTYQEGVAIRKQEVEQAKLAIEKDKVALSKLQSEEKILKGLVQQLKDRKEQIEKAEEKERLLREKEEMEKKEVEEKGKSNEEDKQEKSEEDEQEKSEEDEQEKSESAEKVDGEEKQIEATHEDTIGILDGSLKDAGIDHGGLKSEDGPSDASNNEGSLVHGIEKHVEKVREESSTLSDSDLDVVSKESTDQVRDMHNDASKGTDAMTREELGRLVASRWTGENTGKEAGDSNAENNNDHDDPEEISKDTHDKEDDGYASETDDDSKTHDYDPIEDEVNEDFEEEDHDDSTYSYKSESDAESDTESDITATNPSWLEKIQQTVRSILQAVNLFQTPVNQSEAAQVRKEYDESSAKLSKIQARISSLTQKLKHDFGPDKEFYSFYGRCFESKQNKYVYKVCPYKQASQLEGHSTTRLGEWEKFDGSYRVMVFSNGEKCWNGPDRSLKVKLKCGLKNEVADVDEPSRCEYVALLSTPVLCTEEKLKELQHKLDSMNKEPHQDHHDEL